MLTEEGNLISTGASIIRATSNGDADSVRSLLAEGAAVDQRGRGGHTALMVAAIFSHVDIARLLLAAGADVHLKDNLGLTARDWADRRGSWEVAQLLSNASPAETEPSPKDVSGKSINLKIEAERPVEDVATSLSEQKVATWPTKGVAPQEMEEALGETERDLPASATEPETAQQQDALRFMKFHKQIMAAQERLKAEQARLSEQGAVATWSSTDASRHEPDLHSSSIETNAPQQDAHKSSDQKTARVERERKLEQAQPTATQLVRIAATIDQLRTQEESHQRVEAEVRATSERDTQTTVDCEIEYDDRDATLERFPAEMSTRPAMPKPKITESFNPLPIKRCPECNSTYENPLLVYCAYDAAKLIGADDSKFSYTAPRDKSRQTLWALVAIVTVLGVSLGYLINNYRSTEKVPSAPIAATASVPVATQTEQPDTIRNDSPLITGELSGMEVDVPEPEYPSQARAEGVSGTVTVRVQVNQKGRVVLARSSRGDWRLRAAAVQAAQKATFSPEKLAAHGKVISGNITYNFVAQTSPPAATGSEAAAQTSSPSANGAPTPSPTENVGADYPVVGGPLVGTESNLPEPDYPKQAKSKGISGTITVVVRVNRAGKVISWRTLEGDSQLRAAALKAAKKATFSPAKLPGNGEVVGSITYNFN